ncbi:MAG: MarR family winged helix-turn-helix transcriptional regulator [Omnitrophica WOR_2 bacterium]
MMLSDFHEDLEYLLAHIIQDFMRFMQQTGLSRPQIHALLHIYHAGECPVSEIGSLTGATPAAASQLVERLVQQGLVQRSEDPLNRRFKKLRLTDKSLKLFQQGITANQLLQDLMAALTPEEHEIVHRAFNYLVRASRQIQYSHLRKENQHDAQNA